MRVGSGSLGREGDKLLGDRQAGVNDHGRVHVTGGAISAANFFFGKNFFNAGLQSIKLACNLRRQYCCLHAIAGNPLRKCLKVILIHRAPILPLIKIALIHRRKRFHDGALANNLLLLAFIFAVT